MRHLLLFGLAVLVPLSSLRAQDKLAQYLPLQEGQEWHYKKKVIEDGKPLTGEAGTVVVRVTGRDEVTVTEEKGKKQTALAYTLESSGGDKKAGGKKLTEQVVVLANGIYRRSAAGKSITPQLAILKLTKSWQVESMTNDTPITGTFELGQEDVTVPAGKFDKATTSTADKLKIGDQTMFIKYWFAVDVGIVKQEMRVGNYQVTLELQGIRKAKLE